MGIAADFVLIVIAGFIGAVIARFLRLPLLVGYVAAGVAVGPYTAGPTVTQIHDIELLAELGVALLLFSLGLEISIRDLAPVRKVALLGGGVQMVVTTLAAAWAGVAALHMKPVESIWFGAMVAVSSTMVVLKTLSSRGVTTTLASRVMIGLLVLQDLAVIPLLVILPGLQNIENLGPQLLRSISLAAVILGGTVILGTRLLPPLIKLVLIWGTREMFLISVVAVGVGIGYAMHAAGLSFALGAFVAGLILSETDFSHQALSDVVPLRDIFGLLFFVTVGMLFDPTFAIANWKLILLTVASIVVGKALIFGALTRAFGYWNLAPWIIGLGLAQMGEFSFVLARTGVASGAISKSVYDLVLTCTVLTMALSPPVSALGPLLGRLWRRRPSETIETKAPTGHVLIGGFGRTGRGVAEALAKNGVPLIFVETDYALWSDAKLAGFNGIWGDVTSPEILHAAGIEHARLFLVTMPERTVIHTAIQRVRSVNPRIAVVARIPEVDQLISTVIKELR